MRERNGILAIALRIVPAVSHEWEGMCGEGQMPGLRRQTRGAGRPMWAGPSACAHTFSNVKYQDTFWAGTRAFPKAWPFLFKKMNMGVAWPSTNLV